MDEQESTNTHPQAEAALRAAFQKLTEVHEAHVGLIDDIASGRLAHDDSKVREANKSIDAAMRDVQRLLKEAKKLSRA